MKKLIIAITALASTQVFASLLPFYNAQLSNFTFQQGSTLSEMYITRGSVSVAPKYGNLTLSLVHSVKCETGKMCPHIAYAPVVYQVQSQEVSTGNCGEKIYSGVRDDRATGGELVTVTVVDNTHNTCKALMALPATQVELKLQGGPDAVNELHVITGDRLIEQM